MACLNNDVAEVRRLSSVAKQRYDAGCKPSANVSNCILRAVQQSQLCIVQCLCELALARPGLKLDSPTSYNAALYVACANGHAAIVRCLFELALAEPAMGFAQAEQLREYSIIVSAVAGGHLAVVQILCELGTAHPALGIDLAANDNEALAWAAVCEHLPVVQYLCEQPTVDPARVLRLPHRLPVAIMDAVHSALAQRRQCDTFRAASMNEME